jgi:hypothetical protein
MSFPTQPGVPNRENTAMNAMKTAVAQASLSALAMDADAFELFERDDTVLPGCDRCGHRVRVPIAEFCIHVNA